MITDSRRVYMVTTGRINTCTIGCCSNWLRISFGIIESNCYSCDRTANCGIYPSCEVQCVYTSYCCSIILSNNRACDVSVSMWRTIDIVGRECIGQVHEPGRECLPDRQGIVYPHPAIDRA